MNPKEMASRLHENERKLLLALKDKETATTEELSQITGLSRDAVEKASDWAETKEVVIFSEKTSQSFSLSEEGLHDALEGLPENKLLELLKGGPIDIGELKESFQALNIALVWLRRKNWAIIKDGTLQITEVGKKVGETLESKLLSRIKKESSLENSAFSEMELDTLNQLSKRNLVNIREDKWREVSLTESGRLVLPEIESTPLLKVVTQLTPEIIQSGTWKNATFQKYDVSLPAPSPRPGKRHFVSQVIDYIRRFWVELGFKEMTGEYLELSFWNFDALYLPQDHPARDLADTFYMKTPFKGDLPDSELVSNVKETHENGWTTGSTGWQYNWDSEFARINCLRTHTTSLSVKQIAKLKPKDLPGKFFSVGRVFRNETIDWNHLAEFYQTDGIVIGEGVTFRDMQGYLKAYLEGLGLKRFRFRPGYFPYTEMSMEAEVLIEERQEWVELFGAGMFRPEVVKPLIGIDVPVLAWGPGFDRLVMQSYNVDSIRELYGNDIGLLRKARLWLR